MQYKCLLLPPIEVIKVQLTADLTGVERRLSCVEVSHVCMQTVFITIILLTLFTLYPQLAGMCGVMMHFHSMYVIERLTTYLT